MPPPTTVDSRKSRKRRMRALRSVLGSGDTSSIRRGSQRRPSRISTVVTTSTTSCVSARSGAENHTKVMQVIMPHTLTMVRAASRWYLACQAAPRAQAIASSHRVTNTMEPGIFGRSPQLRPLLSSGISPPITATSTSRNNCVCRRLVLMRFSILRAPRIISTRQRSKPRLPLK